MECISTQWSRGDGRVVEKVDIIHIIQVMDITVQSYKLDLPESLRLPSRVYFVADMLGLNMHCEHTVTPCGVHLNPL